MYVIVKDGHSTSSNVLYIQCEPDVVPRAVWSSGNEMLVERYGSSSRSSANTEFKARYKAKLLSEGGQYTASFSYSDQYNCKVVCRQQIVKQKDRKPLSRLLF